MITFEITVRSSKPIKADTRYFVYNTVDIIKFKIMTRRNIIKYHCETIDCGMFTGLLEGFGVSDLRFDSEVIE